MDQTNQDELRHWKARLAREGKVALVMSENDMLAILGVLEALASKRADTRFAYEMFDAAVATAGVV